MQCGVCQSAQEGRTKLTPRLLVAAGDGRLLCHELMEHDVQQPPFSGEAMQQPIADEDMTGFKTTIMRFLYKDAIMPITYASIPVLCVAKMLKLDTEKIVALDTETHQYNANILINKIIDGPEELKGLWDVSKCVKACAPAKYSQSQHVTRAIKNSTNNDKYPSRTSLRMEYDGVILSNYQLLILDPFIFLLILLGFAMAGGSLWPDRVHEHR